MVRPVATRDATAGPCSPGSRAPRNVERDVARPARCGDEPAGEARNVRTGSGQDEHAPAPAAFRRSERRRQTQCRDLAIRTRRLHRRRTLGDGRPRRATGRPGVRAHPGRGGLAAQRHRSGHSGINRGGACTGLPGSPADRRRRGRHADGNYVGYESRTGADAFRLLTPRTEDGAPLTTCSTQSLYAATPSRRNLGATGGEPPRCRRGLTV
jgi:hypothetical protein